MIFVIRFLQILIASAVPSAAATYIIMQKPNDNLWTAVCILAFIIFLAANAVINGSVYRMVRGIIPEYLKINITVYVLYIVFTVIVYKFTDATVFSFLCSCLRGFESILDKTRYTVGASHIISAGLMLLQPLLMKAHDEKMARLREEQEEMLDADVGLMIDIDDEDGIAPDDPFRNNDLP